MDYEIARARMVQEQLIKRGITDKRVLAAMGSLLFRIVLLKTSANIWHQVSEMAPPPTMVTGSRVRTVNFSTYMKFHRVL